MQNNNEVAPVYYILLCGIYGKNTNEQYFQQIETLYLAETYSGTTLNFCLSNLSERSFVMATHTYPKSIWILCRSPNLINNSNESFPLSTQHVPQEHTTMVQLLRNSSICIVYIVTSHHLYSKDTKKELPYRKVENWFPINLDSSPFYLNCRTCCGLLRFFFKSTPEKRSIRIGILSKIGC